VCIALSGVHKLKLREATFSPQAKPVHFTNPSSGLRQAQLLLLIVIFANASLKTG
jgi:hypothetical protein